MLEKTTVFFIVFVMLLKSGINAQPLYFSTPQEAVEICSELLLEENWEKLVRYYFLDNVDKETVDSMKNGSYFVRGKRPEIHHPGVNWKYKKPFPPNFIYLNHTESGSDTIKVSVAIEIDQGGGMMQSGLHCFYLIRSSDGYQVLP